VLPSFQIRWEFLGWENRGDPTNPVERLLDQFNPNLAIWKQDIPFIETFDLIRGASGAYPVSVVRVPWFDGPPFSPPLEAFPKKRTEDQL